MPEMTVVQTRLGVFNEYIIRRDVDGLYLARDGSFGPENQARRFADLAHANEEADRVGGNANA